jgi:hypothetical protein
MTIVTVPAAMFETNPVIYGRLQIPLVLHTFQYLHPLQCNPTTYHVKTRNSGSTPWVLAGLVAGFDKWEGADVTICSMKALRHLETSPLSYD